MQLPVDIKALMDETTNIEDAHSTEIDVSIYIDDTAPNDLVAHVRNAYASTLATVRMTLTYLGAGFVPQPTDDIAVIVAGQNPDIGEYAAKLRDVGVPVMVVACDAAGVAARAQACGHAIPQHDLIAPAADAQPEPDAEAEAKSVIAHAAKGLPIGQWTGENRLFGFLSKAAGGVSAAEAGAPEAAEALPPADGDAAQTGEGAPLELTPERARDLDTRMGRWIVSVCRDKRLAYAIAFPFVRRPLARDAVQATALQNAAVGLVPFIPGADLPIMTLNQAKMVLQIGAAYGQKMDMGRWKEIAAVIGAAYLTRGIARRLVAAVPVLGFAIRAGVAYGLTAAMGYGVIEYFEGGQNATGVANVVEHAIGNGAKAVGKVRDTLGKYVPVLENPPAN